MIKYLNPFFTSSISLFLIRFILFIFALLSLLLGTTSIFIWEIINCNNSTLYFPLILDPIGLIFSSIVLFISANVIKFSITYIKRETFIPRFTHLVLLFVFSINILIFFPHLMTLLLGWDGLGLVRFILVIYYQNAKSLGAGIITALTNRIGDATLLLAIGWTLNSNHWSIINIWQNPISNFIIICILIAAITKRAQIPFSRWLPAAIAAPTPVSALVHSSTLVTAGVFLLIRFYPLLETFNLFNQLLLITASLTIFIAGLSALTECDLKKIIALSTLSQLGVIIGRLGLGYPKLAFFHLITHALFKALLFICAGSIIHFHHHGQDLRTVGNLTPQLPLTIRTFLIANISLCGLPFLSGFYSKDLILETSLFAPTNWFILTLFFLATILTIAYSLRLLFRAIWSPTSNIPTHNISNSDTNIWIPAITLTIGAIFAGTVINWINTPIYEDSLLQVNYKTLPLFVTLLRAYLTWSYMFPYSTHPSSLITIKLSHEASCYIWYITSLSTQGVLPTPLKTAHHLQKTLDQGWRETTSAQGIFYLSSNSSQSLQPIQKNHIIIFLNLISLSFIVFLFRFLLL